MPSLLDIAPPELSAEEVDIRGTKLTVAGIPNDGWATLYGRFPAMRAIVAGRTEDFSTPELFAAQAAMIAAGLGHPGNPEFERAVMGRLTSEEQRLLTETIVRLSMPGHVFGPLLNGAGPLGAGGHSTAAAATK